MEVLALIGSPRKQGNTDIMADEFLEGSRAIGATTSKIYLDDYLVRPIAEVADNSRQRDDPRRDDDFPILLERFLSADIIVWSTPVYWQGPSAQMKCFLDRMSSYFNHPKYVERFREKGHVILCAFGRTEPNHGDWVIKPMKITVEVLHGIYLGDVCVSVYQKGNVREMPGVLATCRQLGGGCRKCHSNTERQTITQLHIIANNWALRIILHIGVNLYAITGDQCCSNIC